MKILKVDMERERRAKEGLPEERVLVVDQPGRTEEQGLELRELRRVALESHLSLITPEDL